MPELIKSSFCYLLSPVYWTLLAPVLMILTGLWLMGLMSYDSFFFSSIGASFVAALIGRYFQLKKVQ